MRDRDRRTQPRFSQAILMFDLPALPCQACAHRHRACRCAIFHASHFLHCSAKMTNSIFLSAPLRLQQAMSHTCTRHQKPSSSTTFPPGNAALASHSATQTVCAATPLPKLRAPFQKSRIRRLTLPQTSQRTSDRKLQRTTNQHFRISKYPRQGQEAAVEETSAVRL